MEENIGRTLFDLKILYDQLPRIMEIKTKINKWDLIKINCTVKGRINKMKRQPSEWEKIIANKTTDKKLIFKIYKQLMQLNIRKTTQLKKIDRRPKQTFLRRSHTDG